MSLPRDVQESVVHTLPGLERAEFIRHAYAVEYDFIQPTELGDRWKRNASAACFSRARSMARPATKKPQLRA
jgi:tRNA U34 5-carboxymethylaminomethyl modifying enzyme MnmG/GidA